MSCCRKHGNKSIKQYTTLEILCEYKDSNDEPLTLRDVDIKSQIRTANGGLVDDLDVRVMDIEYGVFLLLQTVDELPVGTLQVDILFDKNGKRIQSDTFEIEVEPGITLPSGGGDG